MNNEMNTSMQSRRLTPGGTQGTPESEFNNFECFQNYTAPEVFVQGLAGIVNQGDVEIIIRAQKLMLQRFEKTNEMLLNCNALSAGRIKAATDDFKKYTKLIHDMKRDLDHIFKKVRTIKSKISSQYPEATAQMQAKIAENRSQSDGSENEEIGVIAEEQPYTEIRNKSNRSRNIEGKGMASSSSVGYIQLRSEPEGRSSPGTSDGATAQQSSSQDESQN